MIGGKPACKRSGREANDLAGEEAREHGLAVL